MTKTKTGRPATVRNGKVTSLYLNDEYRDKLLTIGKGYGDAVRKLTDMHTGWWAALNLETGETEYDRLTLSEAVELTNVQTYALVRVNDDNVVPELVCGDCGDGIDGGES